MAPRPNILQNLNRILGGESVPTIYQKNGGDGLMTPNTVIYSTSSKEDYDAQLTKIKQQKMLSYQWVKAGADSAMESLAGQTAVKLMYRDCDLMETMPEIASALDVYSEEACNINSKGRMLNIYSKSPRIKAVLEDLFINRLMINTTLPMICRSMCKYGNEYQLLNIDLDNGVMGWRRIVPYEMDRIENGFTTSAAAANMMMSTNELKRDEVEFVWLGHNENRPFKDWNIAHFRMLQDSFFLPYGTSILHKARRAWRMLSMMEDAMLVYRLDKSVERRVFKIFVGAIDDADVPAYVQEIANNFKRTPIIDPQTGQIDLRKNFMDVSSDYFIPVRSENAPTPIENLQSSQNTTIMDDIQYMQNKIFAALRVPKTFLNFQEAQGKGQNLSLMDIRFCRMVNKIQQYLLLELNKIAMVHLYLLGFRDDLNNFTLSLNNPSAQIEALELEDITKRIQAAASALADPGIGMPILSLHRVLKEIMKLSDREIKDMLNEIRLEKAMAAELAQTPQVIKNTGIFDATDNIYADFDSGMAPTQQQQDPNQMGGGMGGPSAGGADIGNSLNMDSLGGPGEDTSSDISGQSAEVPMSQAPEVDPGTMNETSSRISKGKSFIEQYFKMLEDQQKIEDDETDEPVDYIGKNFLLEKNIKNSIELLKEASDKITENCEVLELELDKAKSDREIIKVFED